VWIQISLVRTKVSAGSSFELFLGICRFFVPTVYLQQTATLERLQSNKWGVQWSTVIHYLIILYGIYESPMAN
jgi:hypothetical protein